MSQHGYIAVYQGNDFCEIEGFPNKIENMTENVVYIWEVVTRKEFMGRGIAKKLLTYTSRCTKSTDPVFGPFSHTAEIFERRLTAWRIVV